MKLFRLLAAAAILAAAPSAFAAAQPLDRIVAVVNDGVVLQSELDHTMEVSREQIRERGIPLPSDEVLRSQVLERLILAKLQTQRAKEAGIKVDDRELNEVMNNVAAQNHMTLAEFADRLRREGQDYLAVREQIRDEVLMQRLRAKEVEGRVLVTDEDIDLYLANEGRSDDTEYRLSHIMIAVPDGAPGAVREKQREKADKLYQQLEHGADFAQLAIANSDGRQALEGGDLGWRKSGDLPELFAQQLPQMKEGDLSRVLETPSGFHLIKLTGKRGAGERSKVTESHVEHILLQPNAIRDEEQTKQQARELYERLQAGADFATLAKKFSDDGGSKTSGGDLGWTPAGAFAPDFQKEVDTLKPGEMSPPFRTQFGWHIARLLDRRTRDVTEQARRQRARQAIQNRKTQEEYETWLRRLREEAYVEYRLGDKPPSEKTASSAP